MFIYFNNSVKSSEAQFRTQTINNRQWDASFVKADRASSKNATGNTLIKFNLINFNERVKEYL